MKKIILLTILCFAAYKLDGQDTLKLSTAYSNTQDKVARDAVIMNPGFSYTPSTGNTFTARTSPELIITGNYIDENPYATPLYTLDQSLAPGYMTGNPGVSPLGASIYEIPLSVPKGTGAMAPQISVTYSSQSGNGILGPGFALSGMSMISRINLPFYARGESSDMLSNLDKQFALDGNRLVLISGAHAQNGAIYKTENESFSQIIFFGTFGSGSEWFQVKTKDGKTIEYGKGEYSKIKPSNNTYSVAYCISKITDVYGNYMLYNYSQISTTGESYLASIQYTGNSSASLQPYNKIEFYYDSRSDVNAVFFKGLKTSQTLLLREVKITVDGALLSKYKFKYYFDRYSYLDAVNELDNEGNVVATTKIDRFQPPDEAYSSEPSGVANLGDKLLFPGDFNGDGLADLMTVPDKTSWSASDQWILYMNSNGILSQVDSDTVGKDFEGLTIGDFNGDGTDEVFFEYFEDEGTYTKNYFVGHKILNNNLTLLLGIRFEFFDPSSELEIRMADFDGDGESEFIFLDKDKNYMALTGLSNNGTPAFSSPDHLLIGDFNGNGINDILTINKVTSTNFKIYIWEYNLSQHVLNRIDFNYSMSKPESVAPGDFNGDGITDLLIGRKGTSSGMKSFVTYILFSTGSGFESIDGPILYDFSYPEENNLEIDTNRWEVGLFPSDFNLDGKTDILTMNHVYFRNKFTKEQYPYPNYLNSLYLYTGRQNRHVDLVAHDLDFSKVLDNNYDGTPDFYFSVDNSNGYSLSFCKNDQRNLIKEITNSSNISAQFSYEFPAGSDIYSNDPDEITFPIQHLVLPIRIVSRFQIIDRNRAEDISDIRFHYSNFKLHRQGKGLLGFSSVSSENIISIEKTTNYYKVHPSLNITYPWKSEGVKNNTPVSEQINEYTFIQVDNNRRYYPYVSRATNKNITDNISQIVDVLSDSNGNITKHTTNYLNSSSSVKSIVKNMQNFNSYGSPKDVTIASSDNTNTITRVKSFIYNANGTIKSITASYGASSPVTTSYTYDAFGNMLSENTTTGSATRTQSYLYEISKARFIRTTTNKFGESTEYSYDPITSYLIKETDFNKLTKTFQYDKIGRLTKVSYPDSTSQRIARGWSTSVPDIDELYYEQTTSTGQPTVIKYFNRAGNEVRSVTQALGAGLLFIAIDTEYDNQMRIVTKYHPYFTGDDRNENKTIYEYNDPLGRITKETVIPNNLITNYSYAPLKTTITRAGRNYETEMNASGEKIRISEPGGTISYHYDPEGQIDRIVSPSGTTTIEYDDYGNQNKLIDIDAGTTLYKFNGLGELQEQVDFKGNKVIYGYDTNGRITSESWNTTWIKNFEYYPVNGQLSRIYTSEGAEISYTYDNLIRIATVTQKPDQQNTFTKTFTYNVEGKIETIVTNSKICERYTYSQNGYHDRIFVNDTLVWQALSQNKNGAIDNFKVRNNKEETLLSFDLCGYPSGIRTTMAGSTTQNWIYSFDPITGNMKSRKGLNSLGNLIDETFPTYDDQDRLKQYKVGTNSAYSIDYDAGKKGNIIYKTDAGNFSYNNTKVHTLERITNPSPLVASLPSQTIAYTPFNKIKTLTHTIGTSTVKELNWTYSPEYERTKQVYTLNGQVTSTKYYAFGNFEKAVTSTKTSELYFINSPSGTVAAIEITPYQTTYYYIHTDVLGSFDVITNQNGVIAEKNSFDPWGRRRNYYDWGYNTVSNTLLLGRGFTGHEHLLEFDLINMNGRVYDPIIGMFLSPDNYVQSPERTQNFNRYTYCLNNPLRYTDPGGEWFITLLFTLGNGYYNGFMANGFEFNPLKWDWESPSTYYAVGSGLFSGHQMGLNVENRYLQNHIPKSVCEEISFNYQSSSTSFDLLGDYSSQAEDILKYQLGEPMYEEARGLFDEIITGNSAPRNYVFNTETGFYEKVELKSFSGYLGRHRTYTISEEKILGIFSDNDIYISSALFANTKEATYTLLHEVGHAYQFARSPRLYNAYRNHAEFATYFYEFVTLGKDPNLFYMKINSPTAPYYNGGYLEVFDLLKMGFPRMLKP